jgi:hypothetical protein
MAQVTIYLDDDTVRRVERAAKQTGSSVSAWIKNRLTEALDQAWPPGYFDLFGRLQDVGLERPPQPDPSSDADREPM